MNNKYKDVHITPLGYKLSEEIYHKMRKKFIDLCIEDFEYWRVHKNHNIFVKSVSVESSSKKEKKK